MGQSGTGTTSPNTIYQTQGSLLPNRGPSGNLPHHQGSGGGEASNNLFAAGERGVWAYVQTLEDKVKQLSEKVQVMESKDKISEDTMKRLSDEVMSLRNQLNAQNQHLNAQSQQLIAQSQQLQSGSGHS